MIPALKELVMQKWRQDLAIRAVLNHIPPLLLSALYCQMPMSSHSSGKIRVMPREGGISANRGASKEEDLYRHLMGQARPGATRWQNYYNGNLTDRTLILEPTAWGHMLSHTIILGKCLHSWNLCPYPRTQE